MLIFKLFFKNPLGGKQCYSRVDSLVDVCLARDQIINLYENRYATPCSIESGILYRIFDEIWTSYHYDSLRITRCLVLDATSYKIITDSSFNDFGLYVTKKHGGGGYNVYKGGWLYGTPTPTACLFDPEELVSIDILKDNTPSIKNVIFNPPATVVFWNDGTKTVVKCDEELFDMMYSTDINKIDETLEWYGIAMALLKKIYGNDYHKIIQNGLDKSIYQNSKEVN